MRILFSLLHTGYMRNYESTLRSLLDRGHEVHLVFMQHDRLDTEPMLLALHRGYPALTFDRFYQASNGADSRLMKSLRTYGDYLRYLIPPYENCTKLRARVTNRLPGSVVALSGKLFTNRPERVRSMWELLARIEDGMPRDPRVDELLLKVRPDVVLVTPYVGVGSSQTEFVKSARALGIPSGLCVCSWDNLTNKGLIRVKPDMVMVWNDHQKREAVELHDIDPGHVRVTGAQAYDHWFEWPPSRDRETFCAQVGLDARRPYLLYLGSSPFIAPREIGFVKRWIEAVRSHPDEKLRSAGILIRPHPQNFEQWLDADMSPWGNVAVWPRRGENPITVSAKNNYHDSLYHGAAVVGINTSGLIEAGIMQRPVYTIRSEEFADTQEGTLHFHHLLHAGGGLLHTADTFEENLGQLALALSGTTDADAMREKSRRFVESFVRPHGLDQAGTPLLVGAIEELATRQLPARRTTVAARVQALVLLCTAGAAVGLYRALKPFRKAGRKSLRLPRRIVGGLLRLPSRLRLGSLPAPLSRVMRWLYKVSSRRLPPAAWLLERIGVAHRHSAEGLRDWSAQSPPEDLPVARELEETTARHASERGRDI